MISSAHEALEALSPTAKIRHWAGRRPWTGIRLNQKTPIGINDVLMDGQWNIVRMPLLVGKPCFGQPTAFARHGGIQPLRNPRFGVVPSKCMRCPASDACANVAKRRLRAAPEIARAYVEYERAGSSYGLNHPKDCPNAQARFDSLVDLLVQHGGFTSSNDAAVLRYYRDERASRTAKTAEKKRMARRRAVVKGYLDDEFEELLERHRVHRIVQLRLALGSVTTRTVLPRRVRMMPLESVETTADVWLASVVLRLQAKDLNPSAVAREMIRRWPGRYRNHNSLRARVASDLLRVDALERSVLPGRSGSLWERFDPWAAMAEEDLTTPYKAEAA